MHHPKLVSVIESAGYGTHHRNTSVNRKRATLELEELPLEGVAINKIQQHKRIFAVMLKSIEVDDIRMIQPQQQLAFALESPEKNPVVRQIFTQRF